jgi:amino acid adenylation domain-containing protein
MLLDEHIARHASLRPDGEALTDGACRLSYRELELLSNRIARCLRARGIGSGDLVLVVMKRSVRFLASVIGVMKAGAAYVPLEVRTPAARRSQIIGDCRARAVICDAESAARMAADEDVVRLGATILPADGEEVAAADETAPSRSGSPDDLACVLYTSGSTGNPKGVMLSHGNIDEYVSWAVDRIGITADDRVLGTAPFYFDMSLFDVYGSLRAGAPLCIAVERVLLFPKSLIELAVREEVTVWKGISSLLMYLSTTGALALDPLPRFRVVLFAGEALATKYLIDWMKTFPDTAFYNAYGPTEATGVSMYHRLERPPAGADERIPIGIPCENTELLLLDDDRNPVTPGEVGEIALAGPCISRGYLNDPEKTARAFVAHPSRPGARIYLTGDYARRRPDGTHEFVGRRDNQVKFMGYRIELTDIESALTAIEGVTEAGVVLGRQARAGVAELVGYVVLGGEKTVVEVQAELRATLPFYMLPKHLHGIDQLPRGDRGKLDRRALEAYHREREGRAET